jgi:poly(beta-D-mannuronate) C5 epimerase
MIVSLRADRPRRLSALAAILAVALTSGALAQGDNEASRLAEEARQAFLSAEQGAGAKQKTAFYQVVRARIQLLEKFAFIDTTGSAELRKGAKAELDRLADDGLSHDIVGSMLLQATLSELASMQASAGRVELGVTLHQIASEQKSPEYRTAAFIEIAHGYNKIKVQDRALRYAALALEAAGSISGAGEQSGAYNAVSRLAASLGPAGMPLADRAISSIPRARDRAYARQDLARAQLKGTPWEKASAAQLEAEARRRLQADDITGSMPLALALPGSDEQEDLLSDLLTAAIKRRDQEMAVAAAQGFFNASDQQKALARIIKGYVDQKVPLQSLQIIDAMQDGPAKITVQLNVVSELHRAGYTKMAEQLFEVALQNVKNSGEATQKVIWPEVVRAMTRSDRFDEALSYVERLEASSETSSALSDLAKRLAEGERVAEAEALLPRILERDDRSHALSGIGRAKARAGDATGALQTTAELVDAEDRGRVLSAVARVYSQSGDFSRATSLAESIEDQDYQVEAWVEIARQADKRQEKTVSDQALDRAVRIAESQKDNLRDKALFTVVKSLAELGQRARASDLTQHISDEKVRARAEEALARAEAKEAVERKKRSGVTDPDLKYSFGKAISDDAKAEIAVELAALPDGLIPAADLVRSIQDDRSRAAAFRQLAEAHANLLTDPLSDEPLDDPKDAEALGGEMTEPGKEFQTRRGLTLIRTENTSESPGRGHLPGYFAKAADVRALVPWPSGAAVGSTFANHNLYISKFLDEGPSGNTRIEQAVRYQRLPSPKIIVVQTGAATLGMVARQLQGTDSQDLIALEGDTLTVRAPIFVAPGASLILSRLDVPVYRFSADAGAFIASAGELHIVDAEIIGYDEKAGRPAWSDKDTFKLFRPFLLSWGDGRMNVASSVLVALGYENSKSFGLSYSSGPVRVAQLRDQEHSTGFVVDNVFRNFHFGFYSYEAENIQIVGNEYRDSVIYGLDPHDRSRGLTMAFNTAYGTMLKHGLIISREVDESWIIGNLTFDNVGSGIMLDRDSTNNVLHANSSFKNEQDGITLFESSCNVMTNNHLVANSRDGLKIRNSFDVGVYGNRIEANGKAGVNAYVANLLDTKSGETRDFALDPYSPVTSLSLRRNRFSANGVGINAQGTSGLAMFSNQFVKQSRRLLGGDVRGLEGQILRLTTESDVLVASTCRPVRPVVACHLRDKGFFEGDADLHTFDPQSKSDCTDTNGSVQHRAFSATSQGT